MHKANNKCNTRREMVGSGRRRRKEDAVELAVVAVVIIVEDVVDVCINGLVVVLTGECVRTDAGDGKGEKSNGKDKRFVEDLEEKEGGRRKT